MYLQIKIQPENLYGIKEEMRRENGKASKDDIKVNGQ